MLSPAIVCIFVAAILLMTSRVDASSARVLTLQDVNNVIPKNYTITIPRTSSNKTVDVAVIVRLDAVRAINLQNMDVSLDLVLKVEWEDHRLESINPSHEYNIINDEQLWQQFWIAEIQFSNALQCHTRHNGLRQSPATRLSYYPRGRKLRMEYKRSCQFTCSFDLKNYPLDFQHCFVDIIEPVYDDESVKLVAFIAPPPQETGTVVPPEWKILKNYVTKCALTSENQCVRIALILERIVGHHFLTIFVPSILLVLLSWVSFSIHIENLAPRVTLGITTLLALATLFLSAQSGLPPIGYIKAIDVWMFGCITTVFLSLIELAINNYLHKRWKLQSVCQSTVVQMISAPDTEETTLAKDRRTRARHDVINADYNCCHVMRTAIGTTRDTSRDQSTMIDRVCGIIIPASFIFFIAVFSLYYC